MHGDDGVRVLAYLRSQPHVVVSSSESPLARSSRLLRESLAAYRGGQKQAAQDLAVSAYLDGFELVESEPRRGRQASQNGGRGGDDALPGHAQKSGADCSPSQCSTTAFRDS